MITTHIVYESVKEHRAKSSKCPFCRKPVRRSMTFEHTINPFNKNEDGSIDGTKITFKIPLLTDY
ncbi:hypothetical protein LCGC14_0417580 [marine sediment metagenome]|uniref:Uncharacterized protein n=1 Tax=marine sediment metagenome TaxID=412755 RepID=A0A0F9W181_9ZZZZ